MVKISVVGLGKLGSPLAACLASKGFSVIGVDLNSRTVGLINEGKAPVVEPGLDDLIRSVGDRLSATQDYETAVLDTDATFIIVPTPSENHGGFSARYVLESGEAIGQALRKKAGYHLVVLTSTVLPGGTGGQLLPVLETASGKKCGPDFGLCYNPEFIALGSVIRDMLNPDLVLIGESDERAGAKLEQIQRTLCDNTPSFAHMSFVNAELSKLAVNTFVTTKISYANMLAEVCERLPGASVDEVTSAIGLDSRIGRKYLKGATAYGGPCFPRDNVAFAHLAREVGAQPILAEATHLTNLAQVTRLTGIVQAHLPEGGTVGILGLAYKPGTPVAEESPGIKLAERLLKIGKRVVVYDPLAGGTARSVLDGAALFATSAADCVSQSDVVVITTPWPEFSNTGADLFGSADRALVVVDCWRILTPDELPDSITYVAIGRGVSPG